MLPLNSSFAIIDLETTGLSPSSNHITCIGTLTNHGIQQFSVFPEIWNENPKDASEHLILDNFLNFSKQLDGADLILTYNGIRFDEVFMQKRPEYQKLPSFPFQSHLDLSAFCKMQTMTDRCPSGYYVSKDDAARKYADLEVPNGISGAYLARIYNHQKVSKNDHLRMLAKNAQDLATTAQMFERFKEYPDFSMWADANLQNRKVLSTPTTPPDHVPPTKDEQLEAFL